MSVLDLIFPPKCVFCGKIVKLNAERVCKSCILSLPKAIENGKMEGQHFAVCIAPLYYEGKVRESLIRYKFKGCDSYASVYAPFLVTAINESFPDNFDIISWVPLSRQRLRERGYDQAKLLADHVATSFHKNAVKVLNKSRNCPQQALAGNAQQRQKNIEGAYEVPDTKLIAGKRILLIDDIVTTGSTFSECAKMLMQAGAATVLCAAVAKAGLNKEEI